eukprot:TRINITY_DN11380_c0_g2_i2.p1 TRINITY_DN11380_c0_g2~~TRINITY_DN11380_c0_g2_i2.p1  ORF type:complete len:108 (+),score=24.18 TRINITY_DN11380_c0_g2_i2:43-324(+)
MSFVRSTQKLLNKAPELYPLFGIIGLGVGLCGAMMGRTLMFNKEIIASPTKASSYLKQAAEHDGSKSWREGKLFKGSLNSMEMFTFRPNAGNL